MARHSFVVLGWSWTELSVLGSQVFGQAMLESCGIDALSEEKKSESVLLYVSSIHSVPIRTCQKSGVLQ